MLLILLSPVFIVLGIWGFVELADRGNSLCWVSVVSGFVGYAAWAIFCIRFFG